MDEQWAVVAAAVAGGVLAGVPALLSGWWSRRSQREQIQSQQVLMAGQLQSTHLLQAVEPRRRVYRDFVALVYRMRSRLYEAWGSGPGDGYGRMLLVLEDEQFVDELEQVRAQVALEGPEKVVEAADRVMDLFSAMHARLHSVVESDILAEFAADGETVSAPPELMELKQCLNRMITAARAGGTGPVRRLGSASWGAAAVGRRLVCVSLPLAAGPEWLQRAFRPAKALAHFPVLGDGSNG
ncbi:hypothetical protein ABTZ57_22690 [Streptomyces sp. NPDC094048]|uniref:hypothetical protein n=1 Tax=unclassified Streptomyces TaxID=2593676 RepID=UPI00332DB320